MLQTQDQQGLSVQIIFVFYVIFVVIISTQ